MPELPEVETVARTLRPHVQGCIITNAQVLRATSQHPLSVPLEDLRGCRIVEVGRRGKLLLMHLDATQAENTTVREYKDLRLAVHLRMTGRLMTYAASTEPGSHTRCILDLDMPPVEGREGKEALCAEETPSAQAKYGQEHREDKAAVVPDGPRRLFFDDVRAFGLMLAGTPDIFERWPFWSGLGPEPLSMTEKDFIRAVSGRKSAIKGVLLDQKILAGVGNIYADESLFAAGIDPRHKAADLTANEAKRLLKCLQDVLLLSISQCGSSVRDYRDANGDAGAFQNTFAVYGRGGQPCKKCGRPLEKAKVSGRSTVCCSHCQR
ncbi:MAG: bifunctional DNA-formamidopyrimidine glycosylase/DNA-(apurinic or apyrimidinic site) lyase [Desulfovibrio sp.]|uniref:bifunctional DNA-formamidopyrimidine glycosylase/DNA-(apurinic or apyrimidinic site) lyase n=1 Tax=Desulfovibrio sp. TaxID=885 RepID=UPI0039E509CA